MEVAEIGEATFGGGNGNQGQEGQEHNGMSRVVDQILAFRQRWRDQPGMEVVNGPIDLSTEEARELVRLYIEFERSELVEMEEALDRHDIVGVIDAHCDGLVFKIHCLCRMGLIGTFGEFFSEVDRSNNTKGRDGILIDPETGKMIKGPNYQEPKLKELYEALYGNGNAGQTV